MKLPWSSVYVSVWKYTFISLEVNTQEWNGSLVDTGLTFLRHCWSVFQRVPAYFPSSPTLSKASLFHFNHSDGYTVIHCGCNLYKIKVSKEIFKVIRTYKIQQDRKNKDNTDKTIFKTFKYKMFFIIKVPGKIYPYVIIYPCFVSCSCF